MKDFFRSIFQQLFGFKNYLFYFSLYSIWRVNRGKYEKEFIYFIKSIKNTGIVLDVGANIGITAAPLAKYLPSSKIHAYEPISENFSTLTRVIDYLHLRNITPLHLALGSSTGKLRMIMPTVKNSRMQGLSKAYDHQSKEVGIIYEVPMESLDDRYGESDKIVAIKIDVENYEFEVLKGAKKLLTRDKPIIYCELWDNDNRKLALELLYSIGYESFIYHTESDNLIPWEQSNETDVNNFFFIARN